MNFDVDYFFDCNSDDHKYDDYWTKEKINQVAYLLKSAMESGNVKVLTIAMSPECCGGWKNSYYLMEKLLPILSQVAREEFSNVLRRNIIICSWRSKEYIIFTYYRMDWTYLVFNKSIINQN